jgi:hypothetical protein
VTDQTAAALFALLLTCFTVYLCFRGIAWVVRHGWRSMLGLVAVRAEAVVEWQDCDKQERRTGDDWDYEDVGALADIVQKACEEEPDPDAEHFVLWRQEVIGARAVRRRLKRMERSDR